MGEQRVDRHLEAEQLRTFVRKLLTDVRALEAMLQHDMIEDGVWRIGAEQELFIVDETRRPALNAVRKFCSSAFCRRCAKRIWDWSR